jgi:hypothetical protein
MATIPALNTLIESFTDVSEGAETLSGRIEDFSGFILGAGKMAIEFAADVNQMTASALRSSAALLTLSARTYDFIGARKMADRAMLESLALSATAEEFERRAQGLLDRAGGLYERHSPQFGGERPPRPRSRRSHGRLRRGAGEGRARRVEIRRRRNADPRLREIAAAAVAALGARTS